MSDELNGIEATELETDETVLNESVDAPPQEISEDKLKEILAQKKHWREKALKEAEARKKLEDEVSRLRPKEVVKEVQSPDYITKGEYEEGILRTSKGYSDEDINILNVISKGKGVSILQAEQDPMFALHLEKKADEERKAKAQLGASRGSSSSGKQEAPKTREEHEALWRERTGR